MFRNIKNTVYLILLLTCLILVSPVYSQDTPVLREKISVQDEVVTLGDLFEYSGPYKNVPVFRSPNLGTDGVISSERVQVAAKSHGLIWLNPGAVDKIIVRRPSRKLSLQEIKSMLAKKIAKENKIDNLENLTIKFNTGSQDIHVSTTNTSPFIIENLNYNPQTGSFSLKIATEEPTGSIVRGNFRGFAQETAEVLRTIKTLNIGQKITTSSLKKVRIPTNRLRPDYIRSITNALGKVPKYRLAANQILKKQDIQTPKIIKPNDLVDIKYEQPGISLRAEGRSLGSGALGDTISVLNTQSNRKIQAIVIAPGIVSPSINNKILRQKVNPETQQAYYEKR